MRAKRHCKSHFGGTSSMMALGRDRWMSIWFKKVECCVALWWNMMDRTGRRMHPRDQVGRGLGGSGVKVRWCWAWSCTVGKVWLAGVCES